MTRLVILLVFAIVISMLTPAQAGLVYGINSGASPDPDVAINYAQPKIGWYFTAPIDFELTRIESVFDQLPGATPLGQEITIKLFSERPTMNGTILSSGTLNSNNRGGGLQGADMAPFKVVGGLRYFLGFEGLTGTGVNVASWRDVNGVPTLIEGATTVLENYYRGENFENELAAEYILLAGGGRVNGAAPILSFHGNIVAVPEPTSLILLATMAVYPSVKLVYRRVTGRRVT